MPPSDAPNLMITPQRGGSLACSYKPFEARPEPASTPGFSERVVYELWDSSGIVDELLVDDEQLERVFALQASGPGIRWRWSPGFYAGRVSAEARSGGLAIARFLFDVSPDPRKSGHEAFQVLLEEIWRASPELLLGAEPATRRFGRLGQTQDPFLELARLRRRGPDLVRALRQVALLPRRNLLVERELAPARRVRRVDLTTARSMLHHAAAVAHFGAHEEATSGSRAAELRFDVPRMQQTLDCAANRTLLAMILAVRHRIRDLVQRLERLAKDPRLESETRTSLSARWPERLRALEILECALAAFVRREPLASVSRAEITAAGLTAIDADPLYGRAWCAGWRAIRRGVEGDLDAEHLWMSPTWEIYERWCFVRMARELRARHPALHWTRLTEPRLPHHPRRFQTAWRGTDGQEVVELFYQPVFPSKPRGGGERPSSISMTRIPDLVLARRHSREPFQFEVYDAKYSAARRTILEAMTSAHVYRDSLRWGDRRPRRVSLLVPALPAASAALAEAEYLELNGVCVRQLTPDRAGRVPGLEHEEKG